VHSSLLWLWKDVIIYKKRVSKLHLLSTFIVFQKRYWFSNLRSFIQIYPRLLSLRIWAGLKGEENALQPSIINPLQKFVSDLGMSFSFIARQMRVSIEISHVYVDFVFIIIF
jgi:hypothetical protein